MRHRVKIATILPYKENYTIQKAQAAAIWVCDFFKYSKFKNSNFIFGKAKVAGRPVIIGGDDFTVRGGSADATIKEKHNRCEEMANALRLPLIRMVEGSGGGVG